MFLQQISSVQNGFDIGVFPTLKEEKEVCGTLTARHRAILFNLIISFLQEQERERVTLNNPSGFIETRGQRSSLCPGSCDLWCILAQTDPAAAVNYWFKGDGGKISEHGKWKRSKVNATAVPRLQGVT